MLSRRAFALAAVAPLGLRGQRPDTSQVPGVVVAHSPRSSGRYLGSPSIAILPDGSYVASHDIFGPNAGHAKIGISRLYRSSDRGQSWKRVGEIRGAFWSNLFVHRDALYLLGVNRQYGDVVIRRSTDGGGNWTDPADETTGLLLSGARYHCAPMPVLVHNGRLWRGMEDAMGPKGWGSHFRAFVLSVPEDADLLDASSWTSSAAIGRDPEWLDGRFGGWLEGNAVATPEGDVVDILRVDEKTAGGQASAIRIGPNGKTASFSPETGFFNFPGGCKKFTIRYDPESRLYWSLTNWVPPRHVGGNPERTRNTVALLASADTKNWQIRSVVLYHPDVARHGFQYLDWQFDGADLIALSRTAFADGVGGADNQHNSNFITFHRIGGFRRLTMKDSCREFTAPPPPAVAAAL